MHNIHKKFRSVLNKIQVIEGVVADLPLARCGCAKYLGDPRVKSANCQF